jgi:hypothetical protein
LAHDCRERHFIYPSECSFRGWPRGLARGVLRSSAVVLVEIGHTPGCLSDLCTIGCNGVGKKFSIAGKKIGSPSPIGSVRRQRAEVRAAEKWNRAKRLWRIWTTTTGEFI